MYVKPIKTAEQLNFLASATFKTLPIKLINLSKLVKSIQLTIVQL